MIFDKFEELKECTAIVPENCENLSLPKTFSENENEKNGLCKMNTLLEEEHKSFCNIKVEEPDMQGMDMAPCLVSIKSELEEDNDHYNVDSKYLDIFKSEPAIEKQKQTSLSSNIGSDPPYYYCDKCNFKTKHSCFLEEHLITHLSERPYKCDKCPFTAKTHHLMRNHNVVHKNEVQIYGCSKCDFVTKHRANIARHRLTHLELHEIKTFPCTMCAYVAKTKSAFETHQSVHSNQRRFKCDKCNYTAKIRDHVNKHQVVHSAEKPFKCDKCPFRSKTQSNLKKHLSIHKKDKMIECDKCQFKTKTRPCLKSHYLRVHHEKLSQKTNNSTTTMKRVNGEQENCEISNESHDLLQHSNDDSFTSIDDNDVSRRNFKFDNSDGIIISYTDIKVKDELNTFIKNECEIDKDEYCYCDHQNSESFQPNGINSEILKTENNSNNSFVSGIDPDLKKEYINKSPDTNNLIAVLDNNKLNHFENYDEHNSLFKTEVPDDTSLSEN